MTFVDNKDSFDRAVAELGYQAVFGDRCYGDFGHATEKGNRILAENVATAILGLAGTPPDERPHGDPGTGPVGGAASPSATSTRAQ